MYCSVSHYNLLFDVAVFSIPEEQFKILMNCVIWALKHEHPTFHEMGLDILEVILTVTASKLGD